jgi:hypothetical protein
MFSFFLYLFQFPMSLAVAPEGQRYLYEPPDYHGEPDTIQTQAERPG